MAETNKLRPHRFNDEVCSLSEITTAPASGNPAARLSLCCVPDGCATLCVMEEKVEKITRECQAAVAKPYRDIAPFRLWKPDSDDSDGSDVDDDGGATGQPSQECEVTMKYWGV